MRFILLIAISFLSISAKAHLDIDPRYSRKYIELPANNYGLEGSETQNYSEFKWDSKTEHITEEIHLKRRDLDLASQGMAYSSYRYYEQQADNLRSLLKTYEMITSYKQAENTSLENQFGKRLAQVLSFAITYSPRNLRVVSNNSDTPRTDESVRREIILSVWAHLKVLSDNRKTSVIMQFWDTLKKLNSYAQFLKKAATRRTEIDKWFDQLYSAAGRQTPNQEIFTSASVAVANNSFLVRCTTALKELLVNNKLSR